MSALGKKLRVFAEKNNRFFLLHTGAFNGRVFDSRSGVEIISVRHERIGP